LSTNGKNFSTIAVLIAQGFSFENHIYNWLDKPEDSGIIYYRLSLQDQDGTVEFFKIITVDFQSNGQFASVYPNPLINNKLNVFFNSPMEGFVDLKIVSLSGMTVFHKSINSDSDRISIDLNGVLEDGLYILRIASNSEILETRLIVN